MVQSGICSCFRRQRQRQSKCQLSGAVFATKILLELDGDENDNLNIMNFNIDSFKIRKNREF